MAAVIIYYSLMGRGSATSSASANARSGVSGYQKYPRTPHLSFSSGASDDIFLNNNQQFQNREILVSCKIDGEATTFYSDGYCHARSLDSAYHPSQSRIKALAATVGSQLPEGWRVCGENAVAEHSISYQGIPHFLVYSIWNQDNQALSWQETKQWATKLGLETVPELYLGQWDEDVVRCCWPQEDSSPYSSESEGFVVRLADEFAYQDFGQSVAKFVRPAHVADGAQHWRSAPLRENKIR